MATVECPHCRCTVPDDAAMRWGQAFTQSNKIPVRGSFDERSGEAAADETYLYVNYRLQGIKYRIVSCLQCRQEFVAQHVLPMKVVHPAVEPDLEPPAEIPEPVRRVFLEAKKAHTVGLNVCSLLAARTALTRMQRQQDCKGIDDLAKKGTIIPLLASQAHEIRLWGNATAHDDVPPDHPDSEDVQQLLSFLDVLFDVIYVQPAKLANLRKKRSVQGVP